MIFWYIVLGVGILSYIIDKFFIVDKAEASRSIIFIILIVLCIKIETIENAIEAKLNPTCEAVTVKEVQGE